MQHFWELEAWKPAHQLTLMVYKATARYPKEELFGLTLQTRKAVSSIGANIAEGFGRFGKAEFHHHCNIARGSLAETQNHLMLARDLGYLPHDAWLPIHQQSTGALNCLGGLMRSLRPA